MSAPPVAAPTAASYAMVGALVLIWGTTFYLVKLAVAELHPFVVAGARIWLAAAVLVPFALLSGRRLPREGRHWLFAIGTGVLSVAVPIGLLTWAQQTVPSGIAGVYMAAIPLFVLPLAHVFSNGETMTARKTVGFVIGFCGVLLLIGPETLGQLGSADGTAQMACLTASLCYALGSMVIRNATGADLVMLSAISMAVGSILIAPLALSQWPEAMPEGGTLAILFWIGAISTGLTMLLRVKVISTVGSVFMSVAGYFVPITALIVGAAFAGEVIEWADAMACALIIGGVAYAQFGKKLDRPRA